MPRRVLLLPLRLLGAGLALAAGCYGCGGCGVPSGSSSTVESAAPGPAPAPPPALTYKVIARRPNVGPILEGLRHAALKDAEADSAGDP